MRRSKVYNSSKQLRMDFFESIDSNFLRKGYFSKRGYSISLRCEKGYSLPILTFCEGKKIQITSICILSKHELRQENGIFHNPCHSIYRFNHVYSFFPPHSYFSHISISQHHHSNEWKLIPYICTTLMIIIHVKLKIIYVLHWVVGTHVLSVCDNHDDGRPIRQRKGLLVHIDILWNILVR